MTTPARLDPEAPLLPPVAELRDVAVRVAFAVAEQARRAGLSWTDAREDLDATVRRKVWTPAYRPYTRAQ